MNDRIQDFDESTAPDLDNAPEQSDFFYNDDGGFVNTDDGIDDTPVVGDIAGVANLKDNILEAEGVWDTLEEVRGGLDNLSSLASVIDLGGWGEVLKDPLAWLIQNGADALISFFQPLEDLVGLVTGNEGRMETMGEMWGATAQALLPISEHIEGNVLPELTEWIDDAGDRARERMAEMSGSVQASAALCAAMQGFLDLAAMLCNKLKEYVLKQLSTAVSRAIYKWLAALATAKITFGGSVVAAKIATVADIAIRIIDAMKLIGDCIEWFGEAVKWVGTINDVFEKIDRYLTIAEGLINVAGAAHNAVDARTGSSSDDFGHGEDYFED